MDALVRNACRVLRKSCFEKIIPDIKFHEKCDLLHMDRWYNFILQLIGARAASRGRRQVDLSSALSEVLQVPSPGASLKVDRNNNIKLDYFAFRLSKAFYHES